MDYKFIAQDGLTRLAQLYSTELWVYRPISSMNPADPTSCQPDCGSGFLYQANGRNWLVTAAHVIEDMSHGDQNLITGKIDKPSIFMIENNEKTGNRGGGGIDVHDGRTALYFSFGGRLIDLFAVDLQDHEVPRHIQPLNNEVSHVSDLNIQSALTAISSMHDGSLKGRYVQIKDRFAILGHANGTNQVRPAIGVPAFTILEGEFPNLGPYGRTLIMQGEHGVSGGPVLRVLNSRTIELGGVYTHQLSVSVWGKSIESSHITAAWCLAAGCTLDRPPGLQTVNLSEKKP